MIFDHRTYTCRAGTIRKHLDIYLAHGFAAQTRHLGQPVLYAMTDVGDVNSYVHVWAYESAQDRSTRRAAMQADPDWQNYLRVSGEAGYLVSQVNKILVGLDLPKS
ncbi:MAG: NIPSNAP family protein [Janthinobacterium lividum]